MDNSKRIKLSISILVVLSMVLCNTPFSFGATRCSTVSKCPKFSWSNCSASFSYNYGKHTKNVYCNACGGLALKESRYGSCVNTSSTTYSTNGNGTHQKIVVTTCTGDTTDGSRWGGCGHSSKTSNIESCSYTTKTTTTQKITYCSKCGYVKSTENLPQKQDEQKTSGQQSSQSGQQQSAQQQNTNDTVIEDGSLQGNGYITTYTGNNSVNGTYAIEMWHYSGGYWNIGDFRGNSQMVYDSTVGSLLSVSNYLNNNYGSLAFNVNLPQSVKDAVAAGKTASVSVSASGSNGLTILSTKIESSSLLVVAKCTYNLSSYSMSDYVSGLNKDIPLVSSNNGYNLYSIYKNGTNQGSGTGYFASSSNITSPYIHPKMISNSKGQLKSGYSILINGISKSSDSNYVGWNTFANGGAVGLEFDFPFSISFAIAADKTDENKNTSTQTESSESGSTKTPPSNPVPNNPPQNTDPVVKPVDNKEEETANAVIHRRY